MDIIITITCFRYSVDYEQSDPRFMFQVDPTLGQVTVRSQLDYEWKPKMEVKILAIDQGEHPIFCIFSYFNSLGSIICIGLLTINDFFNY